ncbi:urease accessory protein UreE [Endozoicomonas elysicola]|uniref:Urease accessory protein UreE n=1 Tax=Endozoicomonas elysicola TaxID=305900 RepID=A0A081K5R0_9GAMM|nr:urease accessory protein UreE [Endozoicomonas elysicola]KEI69486.1 urease accessory protein UreE [Endozoicomonas elysicola]
MLKLIERLPNESKAFTDELLLPFDERKRGRLKAVTVNGQDAGIFIDRGEVMRDGTLLQAETGEVIRITAANEAVTTARCGDPLTFARACYHLGNRHVPLQIDDNWLRYQIDHVLDEMVRLLGLELDHEQAPFEPENGAYAKGHSHHHSHDHGHGHENHEHHH